MSRPLVVKFGGDALATPERIATAARSLKRRLEAGPVVAVASARRGVTDHLLGLVERVKEDTTQEGAVSRALAAASDRALAAGELVAASLLAVALNRLGVPAVVLDAREAGLRSDGAWGRAQLTRVRPARIWSLVEQGVTPVVAGFQGWHRGRFTTLGRGGSDTTAVALAATLGAHECEMVKHIGGLLSADPGVVPEARLIPRASHRFLSALAAAGAKVISLRAATLAEREAVPLRFSSLEDDGVCSKVNEQAVSDVHAVALRSGRYRFIAHLPTRIEAEQSTAFLHAVAAAGIPADLEVTEDGTGSRLDLLVDPGDLEVGLTAARRLLPRGAPLGAPGDRTHHCHGRGTSAGWCWLSPPGGRHKRVPHTAEVGRRERDLISGARWGWRGPRSQASRFFCHLRDGGLGGRVTNPSPSHVGQEVICRSAMS